MKILGISGSNRRDGNCFHLLQKCLSSISPSNQTQIIQFANLKINPCNHCWERCGNNFECVIQDDFQTLFTEMKLSDRLIIACPRYFYIPSKLQAFIERLVCVHYYTKEKEPASVYPLSGKPCGLIAVSGAGGYAGLEVLRHLEQFALSLHMRVTTTEFWPHIGITAKGGEDRKAVLEDKNAIEQAIKLLKSLTSSF